MSIKIAAIQAKFQAGDIIGNLKKINELSIVYNEQAIDLIVFPELALTGYFARDLFFKKSFLADVQKAVYEVISLSKDLDIVIILPCPYVSSSIDKVVVRDNTSDVIYNSAIAIYKGEIIGVSSKKHLPNFDLFDEQRYFTSGVPQVINIKSAKKNIKIGFPICRDIWHEDVCAELKEQGAELLISLNASPFSKGKYEKRVDVVKSRYLQTHIPLIYCNQLLAQDGVIFEGKSFAYDGDLLQLAPGFKQCASVLEVDQGKVSLLSQDFLDEETYVETSEKYPFLVDYWGLSQPDRELADIYNAMVLGCRDYVRDNGFGRVVIGISGGIDSAIAAAICADALGAENVIGVMLPSKFSSNESREDALRLADNLQIELLEIPIIKSCESMARALGVDFDWQNADIMMQNMQSRIRGTILMALTNNSGFEETGKGINPSIVRQASNIKKRSKDPALLITTGNKSEYATGYATIYGDMNGAFNPVKDIYKTELFKLANFRNKIAILASSQGEAGAIPSNIINKPPSAELTCDQKDIDSLPDYSTLDDILEMYIEQDLSILEISKKYPSVVVEKVIRLVNISEFKRQQSAPGVKISNKSFNLDRRYSITNKHDKFK